MICSICQKTMKNGEFDNNAHPVNNGRCCEQCNITVVIPARMNMISRVENNPTED